MSDPSAPQGAPRPPVDPTGVSAPPTPPPGYGYGYGPPMMAPPAKSGAGGVVLKFGLSVLLSLLVISVIANVYMAVALSSLTTGLQEETYLEGDSAKRIAIVPVVGTIDGAMAEFVRKSFIALGKENNLPGAVILRIDSGGGSVSASDRIWHYVTQFKADHPDVPVVSSFGGIAASGGYYIAAPTDQIICEQTGITGSIGVIAQVPTVHELMEKVGVQMHTVTAEGSYEKDLANNPFRAWTDKDEQVVQGLVDTMYDRFLQVVEQGRNLSKEDAAKLATGEIYTAQQAKEAGLIDEVGYLSDAIDKAAQMANLGASPRVTRVKRPASLVSLLFASGGTPKLDIDPTQIESVVHDLLRPRFSYAALGG